MSGGNFLSGALGAGVAEFASPGIMKSMGGSMAGSIAGGAIVGGLASWAGGGDFGQGAMAGGYGMAFNAFGAGHFDVPHVGHKP